jgi:hypothetical protein
MPNAKNLKPAKKGEVRNPAGRPKGSRNKSTIFKEALAIKDKNGITNEQKLLAKAIELGIEGDLKAIFSLFDGAHGKDKQVVEQTNIEEKPVQIQFIKNKK